ncbi:hypothetical protein HMPREF1487_04333 [Pseudomonas sp. HPB0071]|uniref:phage tail terminator-like protein n=1 Tax=unclassified Pseudomonas TaxID=196821 RepID=UPI0002CC5CAE|nr:MULTISPECIES: phage tail terminator-like protein [unclassified Pseudomonas]ENA37415.1 hypothetical protein HMPREF1487_04333 [Pseudomonas sp. HPB0071]
MSHRIIRSLLEARLAAWAKTKNLRVAYQNVSFDPGDAETYLTTATLPALTDSLTLAGDHREYTGIFQVSVVTPAGKGAGAGEALADELAALYPLNDRLSKDGFTVQVITPVAMARAIPGDSTFTVPTSFTYRADTN